MISGSTDNNVMIWTCPLSNYRGEVIEGIDYIHAKATTNNSNVNFNDVNRSLVDQYKDQNVS